MLFSVHVQHCFLLTVFLPNFSLFLSYSLPPPTLYQAGSSMAVAGISDSSVGPAGKKYWEDLGSWSWAVAKAWLKKELGLGRVWKCDC